MDEQRTRSRRTHVTWREFGWGAALGGLILLVFALVLDAPAVSVVLACLIALGGVAAVAYARTSGRSG